MDRERNSRKFESVFSHKVRAGKRRTYFFDVRKTKGEDFYITLTESTKRFNGDGYERHKIFLYKEDFNRFMEGLEQTVDHIKTELMPDYDYDEYTRRSLEWEQKRKQMDEEAEAGHGSAETPADVDEAAAEVIDTVEVTDTAEVTDTVESQAVETEPVVESDGAPLDEQGASLEGESTGDVEEDMSW